MSRICVSLLLIVSLLLGAGQVALGATAVQFIQSQSEAKPAFRTGHTLPRLSRWGCCPLPLDARVELAKNWGYALELGGDMAPWHTAALDDPTCDTYKALHLAMSDPKQYPLSVCVYRPATVPAYCDTLPPNTFCTDSKGTKTRVWSPEAPDATLRQSAALAAASLAKIAAKAPVAIVLNGGEYGLNYYAGDGQTWAQDPKVLKAKGTMNWHDYISRQKARQEKIYTDAFRNACPSRQLYLFWTSGASQWRGGNAQNVLRTFGAWDALDWDYTQMRAVTDLPSTAMYYEGWNTGWTGKQDMLTLALNAVSQQITLGAPLSYNWVTGGWPHHDGVDALPDKGYCDMNLYEGFLKCYYTAGMTGAVAGNFDCSSYDLSGDLGSVAPHWLQEIMVLGRVHGLFSNLENFLRQGDLLPGPQKHAMNKTFPACEFPTGNANDRVVIRKLRTSSTWLITAWAADGVDRQVTVTVPTLGNFTALACGNGAVYQAALQGGRPLLARVDDPSYFHNVLAAAAAAASKTTVQRGAVKK